MGMHLNYWTVFYNSMKVLNHRMGCYMFYNSIGVVVKALSGVKTFMNETQCP